MRRLLILLFALCAASVRAEEPTAQDLLALVRAALPDAPMDVQARYHSKTRRGEIETEGRVDIHTEWGGMIPSAKYVLRDLFGEEQQRFEISWDANGGASISISTGSPPVAVENPDPTAQVAGMDFSWADLSFSFLWWKDARLSGTEKKKGRLCHVVDVIAPDPETGAYAGMRLWIDPEIGLLLQAEGYNRENERIRRMEIKSFKKIEGLWTIQDIDVESFPSRHKTLLRVRDVETETPPAENEPYSDRIATPVSP
ncbi:MAG: outer membrane lipoprotein-sorting protein [Kiritimatiellia bacterium]